MKVHELIRALERLNAPEAEVTIPIQVYTRAYPSVYAPTPTSDITRGSTYEHFVQKHSEGCVRLWVHLPEGFTIHERKKQ